MVIGRKFLLRGEEYIAVATNGENRGRLSRRRRGPFGGSTPKISMITRKRGRIGENGRNGARSPATAAFREPAETTDSQQASVCQQFSSESEDASGLDLEDFLGLDGLNWTLDDDALSPLLDITGATTTNADGDDQAEIGASPSRIEELSAPLKIRGPAQKTQKLEESFPGRINKNAIAARMNRLKKKEYVNGLEKKVGTLVTENCSLRQENSKLNKRVEELEDETRSPTRMTTTMPYLERG